MNTEATDSPARTTLDPVWPSEELEKIMLADAHPGSGGAVHGLLHRVRELERALRATGYFEDAELRRDLFDPGERDYFKEWKESVEYTEGVDALLDGVVPTQQNGKPLWLRERANS